MPPNFLGIGAQKAGTTWLYENLRRHPEIWMPKRKEIHYFDKLRHEPGYDDSWYASLFEPGKGKVVGEITPAYSILNRDEVARVHALMADARIIFFMRNPIERAWSQAAMYYANNPNPITAPTPKARFRRVFETHKGVRLRTDYLRTLDNWRSFYPDQQIFVGFLEDVHFFPQRLMESLYGFLGVDPSQAPPTRTSKIFSTGTRMPPGVAVFLARSFLEDMERLEELFGGYASFWLYCARIFAKGHSKGAIPSTLYDSQLWRAWLEEAELDPSKDVPETCFRSGVFMGDCPSPP